MRLAAALAELQAQSQATAVRNEASAELKSEIAPPPAFRSRNEARADDKAPEPARTVEPATVEPAEPETARSDEPVPSEGAPAFDEAAEAAFLGEAKERGEPVRTAASSQAEPVEEHDPKALPKLDELVKRISPEIRDTLEDLFRARFYNVKRVPKKALKDG